METSDQSPYVSAILQKEVNKEINHEKSMKLLESNLKINNNVFSSLKDKKIIDESIYDKLNKEEDAEKQREILVTYLKDNLEKLLSFMSNLMRDPQQQDLAELIYSSESIKLKRIELLTGLAMLSKYNSDKNREGQFDDAFEEIAKKLPPLNRKIKGKSFIFRFLPKVRNFKRSAESAELQAKRAKLDESAMLSSDKETQEEFISVRDIIKRLEDEKIKKQLKEAINPHSGLIKLLLENEVISSEQYNNYLALVDKHGYKNNKYKVNKWLLDILYSQINAKEDEAAKKLVCIRTALENTNHPSAKALLFQEPQDKNYCDCAVMHANQSKILAQIDLSNENFIQTLGLLIEEEKKVLEEIETKEEKNKFIFENILKKGITIEKVEVALTASNQSNLSKLFKEKQETEEEKKFNERINTLETFIRIKQSYIQEFLQKTLDVNEEVRQELIDYQIFPARIIQEVLHRDDVIDKFQEIFKTIVESDQDECVIRIFQGKPFSHQFLDENILFLTDLQCQLIKEKLKMDDSFLRSLKNNNFTTKALD